MNDNAPESERWVPVKFDPSLTLPSTLQGSDNLGSEFFAESAKNGAPDLWLPVPARARHDEPITAEAAARRDRARREAEAMIADRFKRIS